MSTTYHAAAVVGCLVPRSKIFLKKEMRTCDHPIPEGNPKFCSECGKRVYLMVNTTIEEYDRDSRTLNGLCVFDNDYSDQILVAAEHAVVDTEEQISSMINIYSSKDMQLLKRGVRLVLKPLGLWDEKQFGVFCIVWTS
jgi:hypothetical protein